MESKVDLAIVKSDVSMPGVRSIEIPSTASDIEVRRQRIATVAKVGIATVGIAVVAPITIAALVGTVGLALAAGIAFVAGQVAINVSPVVAMKFANWRLRMLKSEASANPIETLENSYVVDCRRVEAFGQSITDFDTEVRNFRTEVRSLKEQFPKDASDFDATLEQLECLLVARRRAFHDATTALERKKAEIAKARAKWKVAMAGQRAGRVAGLGADDVMRAILQETAIASVDTELNRCLAELESTVRREAPTQTKGVVA